MTRGIEALKATSQSLWNEGKAHPNEMRAPGLGPNGKEAEGFQGTSQQPKCAQTAVGQPAQAGRMSATLRLHPKLREQSPVCLIPFSSIVQKEDL